MTYMATHTSIHQYFWDHQVQKEIMLRENALSTFTTSHFQGLFHTTLTKLQLTTKAYPNISSFTRLNKKFHKNFQGHIFITTRFTFVGSESYVASSG